MSWLLDGNLPGWVPGQPFGEGSERWKRARSTDPNVKAWDEGCYVTPLIGGHATMNEIRAAFEAVITEAQGGADCHAYIAGWRFNPNRDMSTTTNDWTKQANLTQAQRDSTAWGLVHRMMLAGVKVRIMIWLPPTKPLNVESITGFEAHVQAHFYLAQLVRAANEEAKTLLGRAPDSEDLGVVFLDTRVAAAHEMVGSQHQKFIVVRGGTTHLAFCGGVDLAYTRRDAPTFDGDWQSGESIPGHGAGIPGVLAAPTENQGSDLPMYVDHETLGLVEMYGANRHIWHDQHLKLEGPVVATVEHVFVERWSDPAERYLQLDDDGFEFPSGSIITSSPLALEDPKTYKRTHTTRFGWGNRSRRYYIGHGVRRRDVVEVRLDGGKLWLGNLKFSPAGVSFEELDQGALGSRAGRTLEILFRAQRPKPLATPQPVPPMPTSGANADKLATTQIWLTIPTRGKARGAWDGGRAWARLGQSGVDESELTSQLTNDQGQPVAPLPYRLGEFSNMAGIAFACTMAQEFIWIFDQFFWSVPYARLLANRLQNEPSLHVVIVLPPWSDMGADKMRDAQHRLRWNALAILGDASIADRVAVYVPWYSRNFRNVGVYCHAKTQLFDDQLLICGSCNLNERSFSVDSEMVCAVQSQSVVRKHYQALWEHFVYPAGIGVPFPAHTFAPGWGATFFLELYGALSLQSAPLLHFEPAHQSPNVTMPNGVTRASPQAEDPIDTLVADPIAEPHGFRGCLYHGRDLGEVVEAIEKQESSYRFGGDG